MNMSRLARMRQRQHSLRLACIGPCTKGSTKKKLRIPQTFQSLLGSMSWRFCALFTFSLAFIFRPKEKKPKERTKSADAAPSASTPPSTQSEAKGKAKVTLPPDLESIVAHEAELYLWDQETQQFYNQGIFTAQIARRSGTYDYFMIATVDGRSELCHQISSDMNPNLSQRMCSITWNHVAETGGVNSWLFRFETSEAYDEFLKIFTTASWETLHKMSWSKAKVRYSGLLGLKLFNNFQID